MPKQLLYLLVVIGLVGASDAAFAQRSAAGRAVGRIFGAHSDDAARAATKATMRGGVLGEATLAGRAAVSELSLVPRARRAAELSRQASLAGTHSAERGSIVQADDGSAIHLYEVVSFLIDVGLRSSGSTETDLAARTEIAANALSGNVSYYPLICVHPNGGYYHTPSNRRTCLDGQTPRTLEQSWSLASIPVAR